MIELMPQLQPARRVIEQWLRPAVWISSREAGRGNIGQSRIGSTPDLPRDMAWPSRQAAAGSRIYHEYLLQINLSELPGGAAFPLPEQGMLWLFEVWNSPAETEQLIVSTEQEPLQPAERPPGDSYYAGTVRPHTLGFRPGFDLPHWTSEADDRFRTELGRALHRPETDFDEELEDWLQEQHALLSEGAFAKLFGYTGGIGVSVHDDAEVHRRDPASMYNWQRRRQLDLTGATHWRNLLTVHSSIELGLMIGDAGYTVVLIHEEDLERQDFSRVYLSNESS